MRLTPPRVPSLDEEPRGNCAGLAVMLKTRIEWLKALEEKAGQQRWPPPSPVAQWANRPLGADIARQREHIVRLHSALGAKGCPAVDIDADLRRAPASSTGPKTR
jgi:hypothetical protein